MIKRILIATMLLNLCLFAAPVQVLAYSQPVAQGQAVAVASGQTLAFDAFAGACNGDTTEAAVCNDKTSQNPISDTDHKGVLSKITDILAIIAGAFAIIMIIISGYRFITSGGDSTKATEARKNLTSALIGVAIIVLARTIIAFVIGKLQN